MSQERKINPFCFAADDKGSYPILELRENFSQMTVILNCLEVLQ